MRAHELASDAIGMAAAEVRGLLRDRREWMQANPLRAWKYHSAMAAALPRWRVVAIAIHRARARQAWALHSAGGGCR